MKNQRGVTLVELLVIIVIMGVIFVPISMMVNYSLKTEKEVSAKNDVQREARLIMEYMTDKMRNKNVNWVEVEEGTRWELQCRNSVSCTEDTIYMIYEENNHLGLGTMRIGSGKVMSTHVIFDPPDKIDLKTATVEFTIDKTETIGESLTLSSEIYYDRFTPQNGKVVNGEAEEVDDGQTEEGTEGNNRSCPIDQYKKNNGKCHKCPTAFLEDGVCTFKQ